MVITIVNGSTTSTLIAGPSRATQAISGPLDEQSLEDQLQTQVSMPIRATSAIPMPRGNILAHLQFSGLYQETTEDLAREWAFTWGLTIQRSGTLYITGATRRITGVNAVITSVRTKTYGCTVRVDYAIDCGAISAGANP